jgi:enhancer of polycomb-like protein
MPPMQRQPGTQLRLPVRPDGRPIDADLTLLSDVLAQKENMIQIEIDQKVQQHQRWNQNHVDMTREPLSPMRSQTNDSGFRYATAHYLLTPPASVSSELSDNQSPSLEKDDAIAFRFESPPEDMESYGKRAYRRRIGRLGRVWIDRRGLPSPAEDLEDEAMERWKYDYDDEDEPQLFEIDPYDTRSIKFRATIPSTPAMITRRHQQELPSNNGHAANGISGSPPARPPSSSVPPNAPT